MRSVWLTLAFAATLGLPPMNPALAQTTQYECKFAQVRRDKGWVPDVVFIVVDDTKATIEVYDPIIDHFVGKPIAATMTGDTKARKSFSWDVQFSVKGQGGRMSYSLTYYVNGRPAKISAVPGSYDNRFTDEGSCTVTTK